MDAAPCEPPGDQQHGQVRAQPERRERLVAQSRPVEGRDHPSDRQPDVRRVPEQGVREGGGDVLGEPGAQLVGDAGQHVALVHDQRDVPLPGGEVRGHRDEPAEAADDVGPDPVDHVERRAPRGAEATGQPGQVGVGAARQRHAGHELQRVAGGGDELGLDPLARAQTGDLDAGRESLQCVGRREQRGGVAGRAPSREQDPHRATVPDRRRGRPSRRCCGPSSAGRGRGPPPAHGARNRPACRVPPTTAPVPSRRRRPTAAGCR